MTRALLLANGEPPPMAMLRACRSAADWFLCVDGAVTVALAAGLTPDAVVGDLDSAPADLPAGVEVLHVAEQETTDLEKALLACCERGVREVTVLGAGGRRWDHFHHNLGRFAAYADRLVIEAGDAHGWLRVLTAGPWHELDLPVGATLSLLPLPEASGVCFVNVRWPLDEANLSLAGAAGISNEVAVSPAQVRYRSGCLATYVVSVP